jgi:flagellar M-ring protein FliF
MPERAQDLGNAIGDAWGRLSPAQRVWAVAVTVGTLAVLAIVAAVGHQRQDAVLYSGLTPDAASRVITALEAHHVPFQIGRGGSEILVPAERVAAVRIQLAGEGLPVGTVGFGLFDHLPLGASDTVERVDYLRALEGQLTEAIEALGEVQSAQVMLALPQDSAFTSEQKPPRASVMVRLRPGATLDPASVKAITHLVASSVQGLAPEDVSVVDDRGRLLASGTGAADAVGAGSELMSLTRSVEGTVHDQVAALVDAVTGPGRSVIEVSAELSGAQVHTTAQENRPSAPLSRQQVNERYAGGGGAGPVPIGPGGKPPVYGTAASGNGPVNYSRTEQTTNFQVGSQRIDTRDPGGEVRRLAVTVFVDTAVSAGTAGRIEQAIQKGYLDPSRGDVVVVTRVPFWKGQAAQSGPTATTAGPRAQQRLLVMGAAGAVGLVALLAIAALMFRRRGRRPSRATPAPAPQAAPAKAPEPVAVSGQITDWARQNPALAADIVRRWVADNGANGSA